MGTRAHWSGRLAFVLAAAGSAVGLGNLWKFPYIAGVNGGGAFVLIYLVCIALVGLPILIAELYIGQKGQANAVASFELLHKKKTFWAAPGFMGLLSAILILAFYSVVGGWILDFAYMAFTDGFSGKSAEEVSGTLGALLGNPGRMAITHSIFMALTIGIVVGGVKNGLEKWTKILMPVLFVLLLILLAKAVTMDGFGRAMEFLFSPDFSKLTKEGILEAVGHSFFTLSLGMGAMITYGSYLDKKENLIKIGVMVAFLDTFIAILAGIVIFSIVFSFDLEAGSGPGLMFATLPGLFAQIPGGVYMAMAFFVLVGFAALSSSVSILEVAVVYFSETFKISRKKMALTAGIIIYIMGYLPLLSFNKLAEVKVLGLNFFDLFDAASSKYLLPLGGMMIALFLGYILGKEACLKITKGNELAATGLMWTSRVLAPGAVAVVMYNMIIGL